MERSVVLVGALDTKGEDFLFVRDLIREHGLHVLVIDSGIMGEPHFAPDISADQVARAGGSSLDALRAAGDKTQGMRVMHDGLTQVVLGLHQSGRLDGIMGMGGGGGTSIATAAMRALPIGVPKLMLSTVAGGDVAQYVGTSDITMMPSVVDVAGLNSISRRMYANAAGAIAGMVMQSSPEAKETRPLIAASMFGNTTACVDRARAGLEAQGYEVLVFHATGTGGRTMEGLIEAGYIRASLDLTTTELVDEICGGVLSAGPNRLHAAAKRGIPTVLAPGCLDMANFWGRDTVPAKYQDRLLYEWNPDITLMRTNIEENRRMGEMIASAANSSTGPVAIILPLKGVSMLDSPDGAFWDPTADSACFDAIRANVRAGIPVIEVDANINDPEFADKAASVLLGLIDEDKH
jgi:uncharacterized protein (UPF0261 family)